MAYETTSESTEALLVTGGVGTGKTQRLVERAAALLAENAACSPRVPCSVSASCP